LLVLGASKRDPTKIISPANRLSATQRLRPADVKPRSGRAPRICGYVAVDVPKLQGFRRFENTGVGRDAKGTFFVVKRKDEHIFTTGVEDPAILGLCRFLEPRRSIFRDE